MWLLWDRRIDGRAGEHQGVRIRFAHQINERTIERQRKRLQQSAPHAAVYPTSDGSRIRANSVAVHLDVDRLTNLGKPRTRDVEQAREVDEYATDTEWP